MSHRAESIARPVGPVLDWRAGIAPLLSRESRVVAALTVARLALIPVFALAFLVDPLLTSVSLGLFIVADIYDGVLARRQGLDGPYRRALDSIVDRLGIDVFLVAAAVAGALPFELLVALLARDAYCAALCGRMMRARVVAIKADWVYRGLNLAVAAWALSAPFLTQPQRSAMALVLVAASLVVAADLTRLVRRVLAGPLEMREKVVPAGMLRGGGGTCR